MEKLFIYNEQNQNWQTENVKHFTLQSLIAQGKQSPFNTLNSISLFRQNDLIVLFGGLFNPSVNIKTLEVRQNSETGYHYQVMCENKQICEILKQFSFLRSYSFLV